jgi:acyl-CoA dehydrogenase
MAGWLLSVADLPVSPGPLTAASSDQVTALRDGDGWLLRGLAPRVPWARVATQIVVVVPLAEDALIAALSTAACSVGRGHNLASEPRDDVAIDIRLGPDQGVVASARAIEGLRLRLALARALQLAGALQRALDLTVRFGCEREQFGRPVGRFQAVQQHVAEMAAEVSMAAAAVDSAVAVANADDFAGPASSFAVGIAKAQASEAASKVARLAHQIHGAMGLAQEHELRLVTTRLWSWREEGGNEATWSRELGERVLEAGPQGLWPLVVSAS